MKRSYSKLFAVLLALSMTLILVACTANEIAMIENIVKFGEALIPEIPNLSPSEATAVTTYVDSALSITNDVLDNPNINGYAAAVKDFGTLAVPTLTSNSPGATQRLQQLTGSISTFLLSFSASQTVTTFSIPRVTVHALVDPDKAKKPFSLSGKDEKKRQELKKRIQKARDKLKK